MQSNELGKVVEYRTVQAYTLSELATDVNDRIKAGWQPLGGVGMMYIPAKEPELRFWYAQAVVKRED
jgi:hypothetical protein